MRCLYNEWYKDTSHISATTGTKMPMGSWAGRAQRCKLQASFETLPKGALGLAWVWTLLMDTLVNKKLRLQKLDPPGPNVPRHTRLNLHMLQILHRRCSLSAAQRWGRLAKPCGIPAAAPPPAFAQNTHEHSWASFKTETSAYKGGNSSLKWHPSSSAHPLCLTPSAMPCCMRLPPQLSHCAVPAITLRCASSARPGAGTKRALVSCTYSETLTVAGAAGA